jgi:metal-responsive CopG/Arc/MetJ family transcriptional regulator
MASQRISVRIPGALGHKLRKRSLLKQQSESDLVREALESYLAEASVTLSAFDVAQRAGLIGCVRRAPRDLSTNPRYFEGFGKS